MWVSRERLDQAEEMAGAKALGQERPWGESRGYTGRLVGSETERGEDFVSHSSGCFHPDERREAVGLLLAEK